MKKSHHPTSCYLVEEVTGNRIYTAWDKEEAIQFANRLVVRGAETTNSVAVRKISCSLLPPPITENGFVLEQSNKQSRELATLECPSGRLDALGYCVETLFSPKDEDRGSVTRVKRKDHFVVRIASKGTWDYVHKKYLKEPMMLEIWHPKREKGCNFTDRN